jgi:hypothetical protein
MGTRIGVNRPLLSQQYSSVEGRNDRVAGGLRMMRTKEEFEDVQLSYQLLELAQKNDVGTDGPVLMKSAKVDQVYQIP